MIKLDAMGDVLRTTCLLPVMARAWPEAGVTWITRPESVPLLENNPYVTEVIPYGPDAVLHLLSRRFSKVINLDAGKVASALAALARADERIGYVLGEGGYVHATNPEAQTWLQLGIWDDLKRANQRTYQEIMCSILGLPQEGARYVLELTNQEVEQARSHLLRLGFDPQRIAIGIHPGAGARWAQKQWGERNFVTLMQELRGELGDRAQIILLGGPSEEELNERIVQAVGFSVIDTGCRNSVRHLAGLIKCCSVVLSADSLAMHLALATGRRAVVLFGPTSHAEIELFGLGEKVFAEMKCLACYNNSCQMSPNCMDLISVGMVKAAVLRQLDLIVKE